VYAEAAEAKLGTAAAQSLDHSGGPMMELATRTTAFPHAHRRRARWRPQIANGHGNAAIVQAANTAATGRLKNGRTLPSDLMSDRSVRPCCP